MAKPTTVLRWADTPTTLRTEPSEALKNTGFSVLQKLAAQYFNWIGGVAGDWVTWLNGRIYDGYTLPSSGNEVRLYGETDVGLKVTTDDGVTLAPAQCADPPVVNFDDQMVVPVAYVPTALGGMLDRCAIRTSGPTSLPDSASTDIAFYGASTPGDYSVGGMHAAYDSMVVIQHEGTYHANFYGFIAPPASGTSTINAFIYRCHPTGTYTQETILAGQTTFTTTDAFYVSLSTDAHMEASDWFKVVIGHAHSGTDPAELQNGSRFCVHMISGATPSWA